MSLILPKLWLPPWHNSLLRGPMGGLQRKISSAALAKGLECCCDGVALDCERFRGVSELGDEHAHDEQIWVVFPAWGEPDDWPYGGFPPPPEASDECCEELEAIFELPIRDYDTADVIEWGYFGNTPGLYFPNCSPCFDCDEDEPHTWAFLRAFCNECDYLYPFNCHSYDDDDPDTTTIWTVELILYGYHDTVCGQPSKCEIGDPLVHAVWAKTLPTSAAPHNYAGHHDLDLVVWDGRKVNPLQPEPADRWKNYHCHPPATLQLFAGQEPPAP